MSVQPKTLIRPPAMPMATNMSHVVQLVLPLTQFVATLSRLLSWNVFVNLLPLKRLDKHERQTGEEAPIGLIFCAESRREQVELLQMHKDGITVAEYWTELPLQPRWSKSCMQRCLERASGWRGAGVLCGNHSSYVEVGDWGRWGWGWGILQSSNRT